VVHNEAVGRHSDEHAAESSYDANGTPRAQVLGLALLVTVTLVAWGVLVYAAIDFGGDARSGDSTAWTLVALTTIGAAACLFVTLLIGARMVALVRGEATPARPRGGRRAAR
jgi:RsiW-degrading membrane proteinase PrsW (M82 family)